MKKLNKSRDQVLTELRSAYEGGASSVPWSLPPVARTARSTACCVNRARRCAAAAARTTAAAPARNPAGAGRPRRGLDGRRLSGSSPEARRATRPSSTRSRYVCSTALGTSSRSRPACFCLRSRAVVAADNSAERSDQPRLNAGSLRSLRAISSRVASQSNCRRNVVDVERTAGNRLEIARKLRNDPAFNRGWSERSAELSAATTARLRRQKQAGRLRDDVPSAVLQTYLDLVLDGLVARLASGDDPEKLGAVLDLVEASAAPAGRPSWRSAAVVRAAAAAHRRARFTQHAVDRAVRAAGGSHQRTDARAPLVGTAQLAQHLVPGLVQFLHRHLPAWMPRRIPSVGTASISGRIDEIASTYANRARAQASSIRSE